MCKVTSQQWERTVEGISVHTAETDRVGDGDNPLLSYAVLPISCEGRPPDLSWAGTPNDIILAISRVCSSYMHASRSPACKSPTV